MVMAGGPRYGPLVEIDSAQVRQAISEHVVQTLEVARYAGSGAAQWGEVDVVVSCW
jgi:hypothetical protein